jgi:formylglycine-generating enzyme required for sulfatase activity
MLVWGIDRVHIDPPQGWSIKRLKLPYSYQKGVQPISPFDIQKYEFSVHEYANYLKQTKQMQSYELLQEAAYEGDEPITMVSWPEAQRACQHHGGRLPTQLEWMVAASIKSAKSLCYEDISYGSFVPFASMIITDKSGVRIPCHEVIDDEFDLNEVLFELNSVSYALENINGTFGMMGNVWEWVDDSVSYFKKPYKVIKGGSFTNAKTLELFDSRYENFLQADQKRPNVGFRCVWDGQAKSSHKKGNKR